MATDKEIEDIGKRIKKYPDPFFDLAKMAMPKSIKKLLNYCVYFYYSSEWIYPAVRKLARYPITKLIFKAKDKKIRDRYLNIFEKIIKIYSLLFRIGINYFACGNCFISIRFPFRRNLVCPKCKTFNPIKQFMANKRFKWTNFEFHGQCRKKECKYIGKFGVKDVDVKDEKGIQVILWDPQCIDIDYTDISPKDSIYYYSIPVKEQVRIRKGVPVVLETYPWLFIEAVKENKVVELNRDNIYHFKCPTLAENDMGWGKPHILPAFKKMFYIQTLQRGMEAISWMYIVPLMILFPAPQAGGVDPVKSLNLGNWRNQVDEQVKLWKKDPNHICLMPIPLGSEFIGGNARALDVTPLITEAVRHVIGAIGIPYGLIYGEGLQWSAGNVLLRMLENDFLSYREEQLMECIFFLKERIRIFLGMPDVEDISMKKFKMADDTMQKTALINLANAEKISDKSLLDEFDMNSETEKELIGKEMDARIDIMTKKVIAQAVAQAMANVEGTKEQIKLQDIVQGIAMARKMKDSGGIEQPFDPEKLIAGWTETLKVMEPGRQQEILGKMQADMPTVYGIIAPQVSEQIKTQGGGRGAKALPEKLPPRRQETPI